MIVKLVTLPVRLYVRTTAKALRTTAGAAQLAAQTGEQMLRLVLPSSGQEGRRSPSPAPPPQREARGESATKGQGTQRAGQPPRTPRASRDGADPSVPNTDTPRRDPRRKPAGNGSEPPVADVHPARTEPPPESLAVEIDLDATPEPLRPEAEHVSEEPELVEERSDPGAEDGAGAQISVAEPWAGYAQLSAQDVIDRIGSADAAELAAIQLYESMHRKRETVLQAVERQLQLNQQGSAPQ